MGAAHTALEVRPESFNRIRVSLALHPLFAAMVHGVVLVAELAHGAISRCFVRADLRTLGDEILNNRKQRRVLGVRHDVGHQIAATLDHAENGSLVMARSRTPALRLIVLATADIGLINLDLTGETAVTVRLAHELTDFVAHAPCGLIRHAKLPLDLLGGHSMAGGGEQVDHVEPKLERGTGALKWRTGAGINMMAAELAAIGRAVSKAVVFSRLTTLHTIALSFVP